MSGHPGAGYGGDVSVRTAWDDLSATDEATLVDVRSRAEWVYVGVPVLDAVDKTPILIEWHSGAGSGQAPDFAERLKAELDKRGIGQDAPLYFICRSGNRSRHAAIAMTATGYRRCFNVVPGFEGPRDAQGHRNSVGGWKVEGLPWTQS